MADTDKDQNEDWINIKNIREEDMRKCSICLLHKRNFEYNPSGSICVYYKETDLSKNYLLDNDNILLSFTFIDLVNKVTFDINIYDKQKYNHKENLQVHSFFFSSEDELVVVSAFNKVVKQRIYRIDYANQKHSLQETIIHRFERHDNFIRMKFFSFQQTKFITLDGIEYVLIIGESYSNIPPIYTVYMLPKNPEDRSAPTKEFKFCLTEQDFANIKNTILPHINKRRYQYPFSDRNAKFYLNINRCMVRRTKLRISYRFTAGFRQEHLNLTRSASDAEEEEDRLYAIFGFYAEVDLTKLKDVANEKFKDIDDFRQFSNKEQQNAYQFIQMGDVVGLQDPRGDIDFWHTDDSIGTIYLFRQGFAEVYIPEDMIMVSINFL